MSVKITYVIVWQESDRNFESKKAIHLDLSMWDDSLLLQKILQLVDFICSLLVESKLSNMQEKQIAFKLTFIYRTKWKATPYYALCSVPNVTYSTQLRTSRENTQTHSNTFAHRRTQMYSLYHPFGKIRTSIASREQRPP
jgi:hypothetical protein